MIPQNFEYFAPASLDEALGLIDAGAKPLAGGMSLIPLMKLRLAAPDQVVDLRNITSLNYIREADGRVCIGALSTHYEIESSPLIRSRAPLLSETASNIGDVQVRNMGTVGGSVAHADPAADYPAALLASDAEIVVANSSGTRTVSAADYFVDAFTTALEPGDIITEIRVPVEHALTGVSYQKLAQAASGFAIVGVAARVGREKDRITMASVGVTGVSPKPFKAPITLDGTTEDSIRRASKSLTAEDVLSDLHASAEYRLAMARVYCARAIRIAIERAG
jgi:carbon-monoxide dehydrogenase medium subunit